MWCPGQYVIFGLCHHICRRVQGWSLMKGRASGEVQGKPTSSHQGGTLTSPNNICCHPGLLYSHHVIQVTPTIVNSKQSFKNSKRFSPWVTGLSSVQHVISQNICEQPPFFCHYSVTNTHACALLSYGPVCSSCFHDNVDISMRIANVFHFLVEIAGAASQ